MAKVGRKPKPKDKGGRPTKWRDEYIEQGYRLCLLGYTDKMLCEFWGIAESTLNDWKLKKEGFSESLRKGKEITDIEVVESLLKSATGFTRITSKQVMKDEEVINLMTETYYPPVPQSIKLWLTNRQPELWRDKQETKHSGNVDSIVEIIITGDDE